ncbi:MAG: hypothetical protein RL020_357, partial [Pseudomonadota bacterium]
AAGIVTDDSESDEDAAETPDTGSAPKP